MHDLAADDRHARRERFVDENKICDLARGDFAAAQNAERTELVVARRLDRLVERPACYASLQCQTSLPH